MSETNIFEQATRQRLRFPSSIGQLQVEDLWQLQPVILDEIAKTLHKQLQDQEISFINKPTKANDKLRLAFEVVKHIIDVLMAEIDERKVRHERLLRKQALAGALAAKREDNLKQMTEEEILKELEALD